jgi:hypothetical protein
VVYVRDDGDVTKVHWAILPAQPTNRENVKPGATKVTTPDPAPAGIRR